jgi:hypothetical protein
MGWLLQVRGGTLQGCVVPDSPGVGRTGGTPLMVILDHLIFGLAVGRGVEEASLSLLWMIALIWGAFGYHILPAMHRCSTPFNTMTTAT